MTNHFLLRDTLSSARSLAGAVTERWVFGGPRSICLDTSLACNTDCVMCWTHSPLLGKARDGAPRQRKGDGFAQRLHMDWAVLETIIRECAAMGTSLALLGESGEPTLHPQFERSLDLMSQLGIVPHVMTNGLTADQRRAESWSQRRARFRFSLHAGDVETWLRVHPSGTAAQFERLSQAIKTLSRAGTAHVSLMHVIQKANFRNVREMVEHSRQLGVRRIRFTPVRVNRELAETALSPQEEQELRGGLQYCLLLADHYGIHTNLREYLSTNLFTYSGILQTRDLWLHVPCYLGWVTTLFAVDGSVMPCEDSKLCMGRAGEQRISDIWRSQRYHSFRRQAVRMPKTGDLVEGCECEHCCLGHNNVRIHRLLGRGPVRIPQPPLLQRPHQAAQPGSAYEVAAPATGGGHDLAPITRPR